MIFSINAEKAFDKISYSFMLKKKKTVHQKVGIYLNIIKAMYDKPIPNIILNGEKVKAFPHSHNFILTNF